jgi:pilus assembly protein CpaD
MQSLTSSIASRASSSHRAASRLLLAVAAALSLGGCMTDRVVTGSIVAEDYRERHPIVVANRPTTLDVYATGNGLDRPTRARLVEFAGQYRNTGTGRIEVLLPVRAGIDDPAKAALPAVRSALAEGGVTGFISVGSYPADATTAAPIRVSFIGLKAAVASKCGEWPDDLASAGSIEGWNNRPYWNMGCATQTAFAAQVADPRDLVEPRAMTDGDVEMRIRAIGKVRGGADPGTTWTVKNTSIGSVGGAN